MKLFTRHTFCCLAVIPTLLCLFAAQIADAQIVNPSDIRGIAVIGDSLSDGGDRSSYDKTWVEFLAARRELDFGPEVNGRLRSFNVSKSGAESPNILAQDYSETPPLPSQAERVKQFVRQGEVDVVIFLIGHNDINQTDLLEDAAFDRLDDADRVAIAAVAQNVRTAWATVMSGTGLNSDLTPPRVIDPPKLIVVGIADVTQTPAIRGLVQSRPEWTAQSVTRIRSMVDTINRSLRQFALTENHATFIDFPAFQDDINALADFRIGGETIRNLSAGDEPTDLFQDGIHPRAVGNGLIANLILFGLNRTTGMNLPMLTDREILISAGIGQSFTRVTFPQQIYFGTYTTVYQGP